MYKVTFTAESNALNIATTTAVQAVPFAPGDNVVNGSSTLGDQLCAVDIITTGNGAAGTFAMFLWDPNDSEKVRVETATVTATAYQANSAGSGGKYVCTVAFASSGTNKLDLCNATGARPKTLADGTVGSVANQPLVWYAAAQELGGLTDMEVRITPLRAI